MIKNHKKILVVSADDFGYTQGINLGITKVVKDGIVTCVSLMHSPKNLKEAFVFIKKFPDLGLGLHLVPGFESNNFYAVFERQIKEFVGFFKRKPSYLSLHWSSKFDIKNRQKIKNLKFAILVTAKKHDIYLRGSKSKNNFSLYAKKTTDKTLGELFDIFKKVKPGLNELVVHPGISPDRELNSAYPDYLRAIETEVLTSLEARSRIKKEGIVLGNYSPRFLKEVM